MAALKYVGNGTYIHGVPARDLTADEAQTYRKIIEEQEALIGRKLYQAVESKPQARKEETQEKAAVTSVPDGKRKSNGTAKKEK